MKQKLKVFYFCPNCGLTTKNQGCLCPIMQLDSIFWLHPALLKLTSFKHHAPFFSNSSSSQSSHFLKREDSNDMRVYYDVLIWYQNISTAIQLQSGCVLLLIQHFSSSLIL